MNDGNRLAIYLGATLKALSLKDKPLEMLDFIEKNNKLFPSTSSEKISEMKKEIINASKDLSKQN